MHSARRVVRIWFCMTLVALATRAAHADRVLRVCADPNSYPISSKAMPGFENAIATVLARELGARIEYTWWAQRRGFYRNTIKAELCDLVIGVPVGLEMVHTTAPYYRSAFTFVTRADRDLDIRSFDDPRLKTLKIGVQLVGDEGANPPPVHALARRGITTNVTGFNIVGDYTKDSPPADVMRALAAGTIDVAIVWGPLAGGFARHSKIKFSITPVPELEDHGVPMSFAIALGVRHGDKQLAADLEHALVARHAEITKILTSWRVPLLPLEEPR
jgi:mxaJ protein